MADIKEVTGDSPERTEGGVVTARRGVPGFGSGRGRWVAAVAAFVTVLLVGGLWLLLSQRAQEPEPAQPIDDVSTDAVSKAELWISSLITGDVETILEITQLHQTDVADTRMYEFHAAFAEAGQPVQELIGCEAAEPTGSMTNVACNVRILDPVGSAVGLGDLVSPFIYNDGLLAWAPYTGGDIGDLNEAYRDYLQLHNPSEYEAACSPLAYEPGSVVNANGIALTRECAELQAPLSADVARWVLEGRPAP